MLRIVSRAFATTAVRRMDPVQAIFVGKVKTKIYTCLKIKCQSFFTVGNFLKRLPNVFYIVFLIKFKTSIFCVCLNRPFKLPVFRHNAKFLNLCTSGLKQHLPVDVENRKNVHWNFIGNTMEKKFDHIRYQQTVFARCSQVNLWRPKLFVFTWSTGKWCFKPEVHRFKSQSAYFCVYFNRNVCILDNNRLIGGNWFTNVQRTTFKFIYYKENIVRKSFLFASKTRWFQRLITDQLVAGKKTKDLVATNLLGYTYVL